MYIFLIANNRVSRYMKVSEFENELSEGSAFAKFLLATSFPDVPEGMLRVVSFNTRTTKAGKRMADVVFCDEHKNLQAALVWPSGFMKAYTKLRDGAVADVVLKVTQDGAVFVENVL